MIVIKSTSSLNSTKLQFLCVSPLLLFLSILDNSQLLLWFHLDQRIISLLLIISLCIIGHWRLLFKIQSLLFFTLWNSYKQTLRLNFSNLVRRCWFLGVFWFSGLGNCLEFLCFFFFYFLRHLFKSLVVYFLFFFW